MHQKLGLKGFYTGLLFVLLSSALPAEAVVYSVFGNINFVRFDSNNVITPTGEAIRNALNNQYAGFSVDIDTTTPDTDPDPNKIELRIAVTSTASIAGKQLSSIAYFEPSIDRRVSSIKNAFSVNFDSQQISSQIFQTAPLGFNGNMFFFISSSGNDLFIAPRQKVFDPFTGTISVNFAVYYRDPAAADLQRVNFNLSNITATPVPEPETVSFMGIGLLLSSLFIRASSKAHQS